ncbi:hypothetical protein QYF61_027527 [Mycteria americana]|uniref:Reverse transcriptase/retrotransposon-derived protein RNase H-like domain-containing protein n=1 Tax=Mycteria americana TaxID=33587 RepID=A0AAN7SHM9_MYCAM|nr:hypothetical protein QYF61_027527 [Mycteria americana]
MIFPGTEVRLTGRRGEESGRQRRLKQKSLSTSAFSSSVDTRSPFLFIRGEALLVILCIPSQVQLQLHLGLPDPVPTQPGSVPILFPACLDSAMLVSSLPCLISYIWGLRALALMESILKDLPALFCSLVPEDQFPGELEFYFPKIQGPDYTPRLPHIPQDCELHQCPRLPPILTSRISSLALVTIRSSIASPWVGVSITWVKKLSSMHSMSVLNCLQLTVLLFQHMESPTTMTHLFFLVEVVVIQMFKGRVTSTHHATDATWSKWVALTTQRAGIRNPSHPGILEIIMDWPEGKDFRISPEEEVMCAKEAPLYNKLPENEKQYAIFTDGSCHIVGKHRRWKAAVWSPI